MELGFEEADPVYIYSGSLSGYQCFDEMIAAFAETLRKHPNARLIVLTPYVEAALEKVELLARGSGHLQGSTQRASE